MDLATECFYICSRAVQESAERMKSFVEAAVKVYSNETVVESFGTPLEDNNKQHIIYDIL